MLRHDCNELGIAGALFLSVSKESMEHFLVSSAPVVFNDCADTPFHIAGCGAIHCRYSRVKRGGNLIQQGIVVDGILQRCEKIAISHIVWRNTQSHKLFCNDFFLFCHKHHFNLCKIIQYIVILSQIMQIAINLIKIDLIRQKKTINSKLLGTFEKIQNIFLSLKNDKDIGKLVE